jgi:hypothetical protein
MPEFYAFGNMGRNIFRGPGFIVVHSSSRTRAQRITLP